MKMTDSSAKALSSDKPKAASRHQDEFFAKVDALEQSQRELLESGILMPNRDSVYGQEYGFSDLTSAEAYRAVVPLVDYEQLRPWIDRIAAGEKNILTAERVIAFFKTSGSLSLPKLIPVTTQLMRQKVAAFATFWGQVYDRYPAIRHGTMVSNFMDASDTEATVAGIDVHSESGFWARRGRSLHSISRWPLPAGVRLIKQSDARLHATARLLLQCELNCIMCLNPSTLLQFCRTINEHAQSLADGLENGDWGSSDQQILAALESPDTESLRTHLKADPIRAARLREAVCAGSTLRLVDLWPELDLVICWCSSLVQPYYVHLAPYIEGVAMRDYITQSSECMMAIPTDDGVSGGLLAYQTHFFEFIPEAQVGQANPETLLSWQLQAGQHYELVVSTGGGLYRYRMGDCIRVNSFLGDVPRIEFLYRLGKTSSMTGEKLTEFQVIHAAGKASTECHLEPEEFLCYPCNGTTPHYAVLFDPGEADLSDVAVSDWVTAFDRQLGIANSEYAGKCSSGRLDSMRAWRVPQGTLLAARHARKAHGVSTEQVKSEVLTSRRNVHVGMRASECSR